MQVLFLSLLLLLLLSFVASSEVELRQPPTSPPPHSIPPKLAEQLYPQHYPAFLQADYDNDDYVSEPEFLRYFDEQLKNEPGYRLRYHFGMFDLDHDGYIDIGEYALAMFALSLGTARVIRPPSVELVG